MADRDRERALREELERRLLAARSALSTSTLGRLGRTAWTALRARKLLQTDVGDDEAPDVEALLAMVTSLGQLKGIAMKLGQILSTIDVALPADLRAALAVLQTHSPPMPFEQVREIVTHELGEHAGALLSEMEAVPAAAASIGQVHRARLPDGVAVAVKVRYPAIEEAIAGDFGPASVGSRVASLLYPGAHVDAVIAEARARFLQECDYRSEARFQEEFARLYAAHATIAVPAVHGAYSSARVLTTTWIDGAKFGELLAGAPPQATRDRLGEALFEFYVGTLFRHGLYNCDPHPGNYLFPRDGRVALLDYGCCRRFEVPFLDALAGLTRAVHADRREGLHDAFVALGMVREGHAYDFETARTLVRGFYGPMLRDEELVIDLGEARTLSRIVADKRKLMKLALPGEFLFLFRIRFGLLSVLGQLGARANWYRLERRFVDAT